MQYIAVSEGLTGTSVARQDCNHVSLTACESQYTQEAAVIRKLWKQLLMLSA